MATKKLHIISQKQFDPTSSFGAYLRFLRRRARLTQTELSIAVGYSPGQISMLENGQRTPDVTTVAALFVMALGLDQDQAAATQLLKLAQGALDQDQEHTPILAAQSAQTPGGKLLVEQQVRWQRQELGLLEEIPPLPPYGVARPEPYQRLRQWFAREQAVAICGLAGMGKTTLAATYAHLYAKKHPVLWITCGPDTNRTPEALLHQIALFVAGHASDPTVVAPFFRQPSNQPSPLPFPQLVTLAAAGLGALSAPLLVLDDAQHISDEPQFLETITRLLKLTTTCHILFVTRKEVTLPGLLQLTLSGLGRDEALILIKHLASADTQGSPAYQLVAEGRVAPATAQGLLHTLLHTPQAIDQLLNQTAGSPMVLRLAVAHLQDQPSNDLADLAPALANYLVTTVVDGLAAAPRQLLEFLAVWRGALDLADPRVAELLQEEWLAYDHAAARAALLRQRLIDHVTHATLHPLLREPVLTLIQAQPARWQLLQQTAAKWAGIIGDLCVAAHHYCAGGDLASAYDVIRQWRVVGHQVGHQTGQAEAVSVVDEILILARAQVTTLSSQEIIRQLLILHGDLLVNTLRAAEAQANYRAALEQTTEGLAQAALAARLAQSLLQRGEPLEALALCQQTSKLLKRATSAEALQLRSQIQNMEVRALLALARFDEARKRCEQTLRQTFPAGLSQLALADRTHAQAHLALAYIDRFQGRYQPARQHLLKAVKHAQTANARDVEADSLIYLSATLRELGDFPGAASYAQAALAAAQAIGHDYLVATILHFMSIISYYRKALADALKHSQEAMVCKRQMGDSEGVVACQLVQPLVYAAQGRLDEAWQVVAQALEDSQRLESNWLRGLALYVAGIVLSFTGEAGRAEGHLREALELADFRKDVPMHTGAWIFLGIAYVAQGKLSLAEPIASAPLPTGAGIDIELLQGLLRGMLQLAQGDQCGADATARQTAQRGYATGYLIYAWEAEGLAQAIATPPALIDLPRTVCCRQG
jgi:ATP/maltotriose-dependent transcriptional regulator MalT